MTAQAITGMSNLWIPAQPLMQPPVSGAADILMDASGEGCQFIGRVFLPARTGSKTISSAGGKLHWICGATTITFADAGTALRIGIQDMSATGQPGRGDGTFDVYADLVGGTDTLTAVTFTSTAMESGTKTITHGDLVAVCWDMSARGGADAVRVRYCSGVQTSGYPYVVGVTAGPAYSGVTQSLPIVIIEFDDGTFGFIDGGWSTSTPALSAAVSFNTGSTPDEYAQIFELPFPATVDALMVYVSASGATNDYEAILYSDPLGSPTAVETLTIDAAQLRTSASICNTFTLTTPRALTANTKYAVAVRPTSANSVGISTYDVAAAGHWGGHSLGANCYIGSRSNQTGAFSATTTQRMVGVAVRISSLDDGAGGGAGGLLRHSGMAGGLSA